MNKYQMLSEEMQLRALVRKAIKFKFEKEKKKNVLEEKQLRNIIRYLLAEGDIDADTNPVGYSSTPLNALASAFNEILKTIKTGIRGLEKPPERLSYRNWMLRKFEETFDRFEGFDRKKESPTIGEGDTNLNEQEVDIKIDNRPDPAMVMPDDGSEDERFKEKEKSEEEKAEEEFERGRDIDQDPTGARWAFETWNDSNIEQVLSDKRKLLPTEEYRQEYKEYCLYNIDLWLLTYEKDFAEEKGQAPAFTETIMPKPAGAVVQGPGAEFESAEGPIETAVGGQGDLPPLEFKV